MGHGQRLALVALVGKAITGGLLTLEPVHIVAHRAAGTASTRPCEELTHDRTRATRLP